ncbi:MAG: ABC transporter permease subunit [Bacteroidales bacterium]|nr:ABC transporter permease subunit [Bacteroidales bacterium]
MSTIWIITKRELRSFFDSLLAYFMIIAFLVFTGLFTWIIGRHIFMMKEASLQSFFAVAYWALFIFIPALSMKLIAEERASGTLELILSKPVSDLQLVAGKFLAVFLLVTLSLALTLPYYITVASIGPIDHGATITGYIGLLLMSACYISIGIFASSITGNQIVAFLMALFIGIFFHLIFGLLARYFPGIIGNTLNYLSLSTHYESVTRGVIDSKDLIYFFSLISLGLFGAVTVIAKRNLTN